jgi:cation diffusion facilitator CzcD-associated flavoprotein CzcO
MTAESRSSTDGVLDCELCIVGAGYAALNGLNAAAKYLKKGDRVVLVDKNQTWGGQWTHQYDFVRLHQPYRMFTAGDQPWTLRRDPSYLATRREVLDHLASVPAVSAGHLDVTPVFGHAYRGHRARDGRVEIDATPAANGQSISGTVRIRARRLLKATGSDIEPLPPFSLSSRRVRSVGVSDPVLMTPEFLDDDSPVYVIGSGKTAMDCVRHVLESRRSPRRVNILIGSGMWFFVRNNLYPRGPRRYVSGTLTGDGFLRIALLFDGHNERAVAETLERDGLIMNVFGHGGNCRFGMLSFDEREEIRAGVSEIHRGHLIDVEGTRMILGGGEARREVPVADGSWFINCTSHLRSVPYEPVLQDGGVVCAPQSAMGFTGTTAYYVTHLWYRGELASIAPQLFRTPLDVEPKLRFMPHAALMVMANMALAGARLPLSIVSKFQGDFNKWYPVPRRLPMMARIMMTRREVLQRAERVLKTRFSDPPASAPARPAGLEVTASGSP